MEEGSGDRTEACRRSTWSLIWSCIKVTWDLGGRHVTRIGLFSYIGPRVRTCEGMSTWTRMLYTPVITVGSDILYGDIYFLKLEAGGWWLVAGAGEILCVWGLDVSPPNIGTSSNLDMTHSNNQTTASTRHPFFLIQGFVLLSYGHSFLSFSDISF